jgi:NAD(P)-dependent dehydrogenase (short-subunit alcohol dehydrogenase family)
VLVNNAGAVTPTPLGETDCDAVYRLWATNVFGPTLLTQRALAHLEQARGAIVNVSSTFGRKPAPRISQRDDRGVASVGDPVPSEDGSATGSRRRFDVRE